MIWPVLLMSRELGVGGSERQLAEVARALDRSRFEPHVGCLHARGIRVEELRRAGVPIVEFRLRSFARPDVFRGAWEMGRYLRRHRIAIVHTFDVPMNLFGVPVARAFRIPLVLSSQRAHRDLTPPHLRHFLRLTDALVDGIVVNSQAVARHLVQDDCVSRSLLHLCYNGLDTTRFAAGSRCRPPALQDASLVIGVVCAFRPEKGLPTLLDAFARVRHLRPGLRLVLVGDGPVLEELQQQAARLGLGADCHFEPATTEVPLWLRGVDIFVLPSLSEALSNSLMEAMACQCCVVASRTGGNPELVEDGHTGLLFEPGDAAGLADCLARLIRQDQTRQRLAAAAAQRICRDFSLPASIHRMEGIYTSLLPGGGVERSA